MPDGCGTGHRRRPEQRTAGGAQSRGPASLSGSGDGERGRGCRAHGGPGANRFGERRIRGGGRGVRVRRSEEKRLSRLVQAGADSRARAAGSAGILRRGADSVCGRRADAGLAAAANGDRSRKRARRPCRTALYAVSTARRPRRRRDQTPAGGRCGRRRRAFRFGNIRIDHVTDAIAAGDWAAPQSLTSASR